MRKLKFKNRSGLRTNQASWKESFNYTCEKLEEKKKETQDSLPQCPLTALCVVRSSFLVWVPHFQSFQDLSSSVDHWTEVLLQNNNLDENIFMIFKHINLPVLKHICKGVTVPTIRQTSRSCLVKH